MTSEYPISDAVFKHWFQSRMVKVDPANGAALYCDATQENYEELSIYYKSLPPEEKPILTEMVGIGWAFTEIRFDNYNAFYELLTRYEKNRRAGITVVKQLAAA